MKRILLLFGALIALMLLAPVPGPREVPTEPLPAQAAWLRAGHLLAGPEPPEAEAYAAVVRELEIVCGDPAGAVFIARTLARWPEYEPARRARAMQAVRHGRSPLDGTAGGRQPKFAARH